MRATTIHAPFDVRLSEVPDPVIEKPTDAVVKIVAGCICGSDLWPYRGENKITPGSRIGHEYVGIVQEVGAEVRTVKPGDFVVTPFVASDGTCPNCLAGYQTACQNLVGIGSDKADGGQGEFAKVPWADGTLVATPGVPDDALVPSLLTLSDVMGTGWHAARCARVKAGDTVVVVGDGAVGLCGVLAAARMGAERVIALSRHESRQEIARQFGATHIIPERGDEAKAAVLELTTGVGADAVLECVGTDQSFQTAFDIARPGATVGFVGVPHGVEVPVRTMFRSNVGLSGGMAPARQYLPELMADVLSGAINPGLVFDLELPLEDVAEGYKLMHERRAIKVLLRP
ncbi:zinc-dependent alcohol dehydrogenase family protein [Streptomyces sp. SID13031]|uniref:zinc-dependent alcohol dehydrogenase family protein n=1 Tax=Streptomyces sp. SID13031 TaxID=2706046 RepID=UPI0013CC6EB2|nr:zinc-dependent alcohol dehydrogenase family protein [Streptomyces sp. SID13031]NEA36116.1 zinc-dependent alcohol dehydrogenase family protein [Streptomyces sp. SID13031]